MLLFRIRQVTRAPFALKYLPQGWFPAVQGLLRDRCKRRGANFEVDALHLEQSLILLDEGILGLHENVDERGLAAHGRAILEFLREIRARSRDADAHSHAGH